MFSCILLFWPSSQHRKNHQFAYKKYLLECSRYHSSRFSRFSDHVISMDLRLHPGLVPCSNFHMCSCWSQCKTYNKLCYYNSCQCFVNTHIGIESQATLDQTWRFVLSEYWLQKTTREKLIDWLQLYCFVVSELSRLGCWVVHRVRCTHALLQVRSRRWSHLCFLSLLTIDPYICWCSVECRHPKVLTRCFWWIEKALVNRMSHQVWTVTAYHSAQAAKLSTLRSWGLVFESWCVCGFSWF